MSDPLDLGQGLDGNDGTSTGDAPLTEESPNRQPVRWQDDPAYRKRQAETDRAVAQAQRENYELRQRLSQVESNVHRTAMSGLDREGQLAYENQLYQQQLDEIKRERDLQAYAIQVKADIDDIVKATGIPRDELEDALNNQQGFTVHHAWKMGNDYLAKNGKGNRKLTREEEIERDADDRVDVGTSSKPRSASGKLLERWKTARKNYDQREQIRIMAEADDAGVELPD